MVAAQGVLGAAAVVGDEHRVGAVLHRQLRLFAGDDALQHHLHLGGVAQALDVVPVERRTRPRRARDVAMHRPLVARLVLVAALAQRAVVVLLALRPARQLAVAAAEQVDRPHDHRAPGGLDLVERALVDVPVLIRIELEPVRLAARLGDRFVGLRALVRLHLQDAAGLAPRAPRRSRPACGRPRAPPPGTGTGACSSACRTASPRCRAWARRVRAGAAAARCAGSPRGWRTASRGRRRPCGCSSSAGAGCWRGRRAPGPRR